MFTYVKVYFRNESKQFKLYLILQHLFIGLCVPLNTKETAQYYGTINNVNQQDCF